MIKVPISSKLQVEINNNIFIIIPKLVCAKCGFGQSINYLPDDPTLLRLEEFHAPGCVEEIKV